MKIQKSPYCRGSFAFVANFYFSVPVESVLKLSIIIPTLNEADNVRMLVPRLHRVTRKLMTPRDYEILLVDAGSDDGIEKVAEKHVAKLLQAPRGYGRALDMGFNAAQGDYIITMDTDLSHSPYIIPQLYSYRTEAELVLASRYVESGYSSTEWTRSFLSRALNVVFGFVLDVNVKDMSSGFRLYHRKIFQEIRPEKKNFVVLLEILLKTWQAGFRIREIPFHYHPRKHGGSKARVFQFGMEYLGFLLEGWRIRNSVKSADYETGTFSSRNPFQRAWHRKRHEIVIGMARDHEKILDAGCGSSPMLDGLPQAHGCDISLNKLRYKRAPLRQLVRGDVYYLPFQTGHYDAVILSEVIEQLDGAKQALDEIVRVVRSGGCIIIATIDYTAGAKTFMNLYGFLNPSGYGARHKSKYTLKALKKAMKSRGCRLIDQKTVFNLEIILKFQKQ